jgi:hypothetical protein
MEKWMKQTFVLVVAVVLSSITAAAEQQGTGLSPDQEAVVKMLDAMKSDAPAVREMLAPFKTRNGGIFCPSYFSLPEARAAVSARDQAWFIKTGCFSAQGAMRVELMDAPTGRNMTWHGRIYLPDSREGVNMYFDQYDVLTTALAGKPGSAQEFPSLDTAEKWAAQHDLAKLPHTVVKPPGAGRIFYILQFGPAAYPTLEIACDYQQKCEIAGKLPR